MTDVKASSGMTQARPIASRALAAVAALAAALAALALWSRFGEGVYGQVLLNAFIACF